MQDWKIRWGRGGFPLPQNGAKTVRPIHGYNVLKFFSSATASFTRNAGANAFANTLIARAARMTMTDFCSLISCGTTRSRMIASLERDAVFGTVEVVGPDSGPRCIRISMKRLTAPCLELGGVGDPNVPVGKCIEARAFTALASKASGIPSPWSRREAQKVEFRVKPPRFADFPGGCPACSAPRWEGRLPLLAGTRQRTIVPATSGLRISRRSFMQMSWAALTNTWVPLVRSWSDACSPSFG